MSDQGKSRERVVAYSPEWVAGYQARCREEVETYLKIVEAGHQVYDRVIRGLVGTPTFAELETARLAVLAEAHAAELHVGRPVLDVPGRKGCPVCMEARDAVYLSTTDETAVHVPHLHDADGPACSRILCHTTDSRPCWACGGAAPCRVVTEVREQPDVMARARRARGGRGEVDAPLGKFAQAVADANRGPVPAHNGSYGAPKTDICEHPDDQVDYGVCAQCGRTVEKDTVKPHYGALVDTQDDTVLPS